MQQHPIPQNVLSVEFQLIGGMTIRQFAYIGVGGILAFLFFVLPIWGFVKWPLILTVGLFFVSLAYLPINDIGFDRWIIAFFRAINSPTKRIWRKEPKGLSILNSAYSQRLIQRAPTPPVADRTKLDEYLASLRAGQPRSELDVAEEAYINSLPFDVGGPAPIPRPPSLVPTSLQEARPLVEERRTVEEDLTKPVPLQPSLKPVITVHMPDKNIYVKKVSTTTVNRTLHTLESLESTVLPIRGEKTFEPSEELKQELHLEAPVDVISPPVTPAAPPTAQAPLPPSPPPIPPQIEVKPVGYTTEPPRPSFNVAEVERKLAQEAEAAREMLQQHNPLRRDTPPAVINTPTAPPVNQTPPPPTAPIPPQPEIKENQPPVINHSHPEVVTPPPTPISPASSRGIPATPAFGKMAPAPATVPNVVVGLIRDKQGLLLTEVIVIVKDTEDEPVRALKSNKVGQFAISTPLPSGEYSIEFEKEGFKFDKIAINLEGKIFQPIEIRAK